MHNSKGIILNAVKIACFNLPMVNVNTSYVKSFYNIYIRYATCKDDPKANQPLSACSYQRQGNGCVTYAHVFTGRCQWVFAFKHSERIPQHLYMQYSV